ncbi:MAG: hypothetical protein SVS15_02415 [Thermodesulfobacteriota bacterium]|nr:hypothetical protein [Thermodesulfobacteriota bacterium]
MAMINDDSNEVGQVHFGFVHVLNLKEPLVKPKEKSINEPKFQTIVQLKENMDKFETWSQICIQAMDKIIRHK